MTIDPINIPQIPFDRIQGRMQRLWDPFERNPHIAVFSVTGGGKSHLIRYGILPLRESSRIVIVDVKDDRDSIWREFGERVDELPPAFFGNGDGPVNSRYRLVVNRSVAKQQIKRALEQIRSEGHCVVVIDESRSVTEREQVGLGSLVENLILEGRGLGISMIIGAQSTAWAVSALKDQPTAYFVGLTGSVEQAKQLANLAGYGKELIPTINSIPARDWLYGDRWESEPILALTTAPGK